jgi:hypothetical protein
MVKLGEFFPVFGRVARFATGECAIRPPYFHSFAELPFVRIDVTNGTRPIFKLVLHGRR